MNFDDILNKAKSVAEAASKKTGEVVEVAKLRLQVANLNGELQNSFENLGTIVYEFRKSGIENEELMNICMEEINGYIAELEQLKHKIDLLNNVAKCQTCGSTNPQTAHFCSSCGAELPVKEQPSEESAKAESCSETAQPVEAEPAANVPEENTEQVKF